MSFLKKIFGTEPKKIESNADFWSWFNTMSDKFLIAVKNRDNIEENFFNMLSQKLNELKPGYFYLTGMLSDHTAELVITADGDLNNIAFVEELVAAAPSIQGWKFTANKQPLSTEGLVIKMGAYEYKSGNMYFYAQESADYPDEINITVVHDDINDENSRDVIPGVFIFLEHNLGELNAMTIIDNLKIIGHGSLAAEKELIPIDKLQSFLQWRQKEFVERYDGTLYRTDNGGYAMMEGNLEDGSPLFAIVNTTLLEWDGKASHPWMFIVKIKYHAMNSSGMPDQDTVALLDQLEDELLADLKDYEGYLNIGRETVKGRREIYFACKDFRKPSIAGYRIQQKYGSEVGVSYNIFKDKYWSTLDRFK